MLEKLFDRRETPPAILLGTGISALAVARSLGRKGIPVLVADHDFRNFAQFSRYVTSKELISSPLDPVEHLYRDLVDLGKRLPQKGILFPCSDDWCLALSRCKDRLTDWFYVSPVEAQVFETILNKQTLYASARQVGIPIIPCFDLKEHELQEIMNHIRFPSIVRPAVKEDFGERFGTSVLRVDNYSDLMNVASQGAQYHLLVQEMVPPSPDSLYTVAGYTRMNDYEFQGVYVASRKKSYPAGVGTSCLVESAEYPELIEHTRRLFQHLKYSGIAEVEYIWDPRDSQFKLLDVNPRPWKWIGLPIEAGVDLPWLYYSDLLGREEKAQATVKNSRWISSPDYLKLLSVEQEAQKLDIEDWISLFQGSEQSGWKTVDSLYSSDDPMPFVAYFQRQFGTKAPLIKCEC